LERHCEFKLRTDATHLQEVLPILRERYQVASLGVFGSRVRGDGRADSDLVLLVTFDEAPIHFRFIELEQFFSDRLRAGIRDKLIHDYARVNLEVVWKTVRVDLPKMLIDIRAVVARESNGGE
jgi:hypothetical protein